MLLIVIHGSADRQAANAKMLRDCFMERSGMRWALNGAQAMLGLRSIHLSGLRQESTQLRIRRECRRLYPFPAANDQDLSMPVAA
jgi:hypothetical protein